MSQYYDPVTKKIIEKDDSPLPVISSIECVPDEDAKGKCISCGDNIYVEDNLLCINCFRAKRITYVVCTLLCTVAFPKTARYITELLFYYDQLAYEIILGIIWIVYKLIMCKFTHSPAPICPSVIIFWFLYKQPKRSKTNKGLFIGNYKD